MAEIGAQVKAKIVAVYPSERVRGTGFESHRWFETGNYCIVEVLDDGWGNKGNTYNMHNGSVQNIPEEDRIVGKVGYMEWVQYGGYCGPVWRSK